MKPLTNVKIISDGRNTKVIDNETGKLMGCVQNIIWTCSAEDGLPRCTIEIIGVPFEGNVLAKVTNDTLDKIAIRTDALAVAPAKKLTKKTSADAVSSKAEMCIKIARKMLGEIEGVDEQHIEDHAVSLLMLPENDFNNLVQDLQMDNTYSDIPKIKYKNKYAQPNVKHSGRPYAKVIKEYQNWAEPKSKQKCNHCK